MSPFGERAANEYLVLCLNARGIRSSAEMNMWPYLTIETKGWYAEVEEWGLAPACDRAAFLRAPTYEAQMVLGLL